MVFSSLIFIFAYLPITLAVYFLVPHRVRNLALFVLSLLFYGWGEPKYIALMLFSIISAYAFGFGVDCHVIGRLPLLCKTEGKGSGFLGFFDFIE